MNLSKYILLIFIIVFHQVAFSGNWEFDGMKLKGMNAGFQLNFNSIRTPLDTNLLTAIEIKCSNSNQMFPLLSCKKGTVSYRYQQIQYSFLFNGWINLSNNSWNITFSNKQHNLRLISQSNQSSKLSIILDQVSVQQLDSLIMPYINIDFNSVSANISAQMEIDFSTGLLVNSNYQIQQLNWESDDGSYVLAESTVAGQFEYKQNDMSASLLLSNDFVAGEGLFGNVYLLFSDAQISTSSQLKFDADMNVVSHMLDISMNDVNHLKIQLNNIGKGSLAINFSFKDLQKLRAYELDSYLEILGINDLDIVGQAFGSIDFKDNKISRIDANIEGVSFEIESKRTEALDLNAELHWHAIGDEQISIMNWNSLVMAGMPIQKSELQLSSVGASLTVTPETIIPVFDGSIIVHQLAMDKIFEPQIDIIFDGEVTPISLALITEKMNWPVMQGSISGKIPGMKKHGQSISFDGSLDINVFDGQMHIDHLSMERLLGIAPVIAADVTFENLNLQQITSTFDFGEITGLVKGYIKQLRITNWKADRLEASIQSASSKKIKQTISQRAIDNISSIGGIQGALSRSFLRFFDSFKYKKIGIGCKLRNSICEMSGIKTGDNTYKLIEGRGIPSINIIGYQKFIDWEVFLDRLLNAGY
jgi:hypothetical protein